MTRDKKNHALVQYFSATIASITAVGFVCGYSWPSPALPYLRGENSKIRISKDQSAWIASLYPLGLIIGYLLNPLFIDRLGRKKTLLMFSLPQISSWFLIIMANDYRSLYIARVIGGIGYGGGISSSTVYISEIGDVHTRGVFLVLLKCMMNLGFLFTMLLGAFLNYQNMNHVLLTMPVIFVAIFIFMPDSSYFREFSDKKEEDATVKLKLLQDGEENVQTRDKIKVNDIKSKMKTDHTLPEKNNETVKLENINLDQTNKVEIYEVNKTIKNERVETSGKFFVSNSDEIDENINKDKIDNSENKTFSIKENILWKLFSIPNHRRALEITLFMGLTNILSGHAGITTFTQQIFTYEGAFLPPEKATVVLATTTLIISLLSTQIVERVRRKMLMIWTGVIGAIALLFVGIFFFCKERKMNVELMEWVPLFGITTYDVMLSCGMGNVFYVYQGELFASEVKSESIAFNKISYMALSFLFLLQFQNFVDVVGISFSFWCFMIGILFGTFSVCVLTPETKGINLNDIQVLLKSKKLFY